jgi:hypothetical protein
LSGDVGGGGGCLAVVVVSGGGCWYVADGGGSEVHTKENGRKKRRGGIESRRLEPQELVKGHHRLRSENKDLYAKPVMVIE